MVNFNYYENEDAEPYALVYDPAVRAMVDSDLLTQLFAEHQAMQAIYPTMPITMGMNGSKIYFNVANKLLCLDMAKDGLSLVKEYNVVHAVRDDSNQAHWETLAALTDEVIPDWQTAAQAL